ncbi:MAG: type I pullulanase [Acutalibacteraceae bacterium]|nr:type I pullulanase [Acutalibacteraceae bacterium]
MTNLSANADGKFLQENYHSVGDYYNAKEIYPLYNGNDLGATYTKEQTVFKVWAPSASSVSLNLYKTGSDVEHGACKFLSTYMKKNPANGVWSIAVSSDLKGVYYTYTVVVDGVERETQDVYSKAVGVNGNRSMVVDLKATNPEGWEDDRHVLVDKPTDAVIWEVHVRDFSISKTSGVNRENRGKYLAFTQRGTKVNRRKNISSCVEYLVEQGVNYVHLNPVFDFGSVDEAMQTSQYNWGYDPVNFNVPEGSYATNAAQGDIRINEFKQMVQALHDRGIGVIMDVVYNHVYSAGDSCFEKTVPGYYFRMYSKYEYFNGSGCGNVTASDKAMFRKYMIDSITYWADEYHIDGFRFDLMGCHDVDTMNKIREALDEIDPRILMYGEPWMADWMGNGIHGDFACVSANAYKVSPRVGMFSDKIRNSLKGNTDDESIGYIQGAAHINNDIKSGMLGGASDIFGRWARQPMQCITYNSAHDNLTLWDKILKSNGSNDYNGLNHILLAQNKLSAVIVLTSQGVPFYLAGEEFARTKYGDHNSYKSPDSVNKIDWTRVQKYDNLVKYYKGLTELRMSYSPFRAGDESAAANTYFVENGSAIAYTIRNTTENAHKEWGTVAVLVNNAPVPKALELRVNGDVTPDKWAVVVNSDRAGVERLGTINGNVINVPPRSALVLVDDSTFDRLKKVDKSYRTVVIKHIDKDHDKVIKEVSSHYIKGTTYRAYPYNSMLFDYTLMGHDGELSGIVGDKDIEICFYYKKDERETFVLSTRQITDDGTPIMPTSSRKLKKGDKYAVKHTSVQGYELDTDKLPQALGVIKEDTTVTYIYKPVELSPLRIHYYNVNSWMAPHVYVYDERGGSARPLSEQWPGTEMNVENNNGWWSFGDLDIDEAQVMFSDGIFAQDPGANHPGYKVSGEVWVKDQKVYFNSKVVISHVDIYGTKLVDDVVIYGQNKCSDDTYIAMPIKELGRVLNSIGEVSGAWSTTVENVVFVYDTKKHKKSK